MSALLLGFEPDASSARPTLYRSDIFVVFVEKDKGKRPIEKPGRR
jgi:hypothetical protein